KLLKYSELYKYSKNYFYLKGIKNQQPKSTKNRYFFEQILMTIFEHPTLRGAPNRIPSQQ
ncbi:MAG: hypothetical protein SPE17_03370, partial [Alloprevotella sp.]|nr:hypothetical protein [Alloprevotella sp.]